jgi:hypothetical protein
MALVTLTFYSSSIYAAPRSQPLCLAPLTRHRLSASVGILHSNRPDTAVRNRCRPFPLQRQPACPISRSKQANSQAVTKTARCKGDAAMPRSNCLECTTSHSRLGSAVSAYKKGVEKPVFRPSSPGLPSAYKRSHASCHNTHAVQPDGWRY